MNKRIIKKKSILPVAILNTTIATCDGNYSLKEISLEEARGILRGKNVLSAIGHQSTAELCTTLFEREVPMNRIQFSQKPFQKAICVKLNGRPEEGKVYSLDEIEAIGYTLKLLVRTK